MKKIYTHLMTLAIIIAGMTTFTSCEEEDGYLADLLRNRDWQGYIGTYYQDRWGISGNDYATVMKFMSKDAFYTSGRGYELNYNIHSARQNYAYCTFKWFIVDGEITLIYDDSKWNPIYIQDYSLNSRYFRGYIYDGTNRNIRFEFESLDGGFSDWGYYNTSEYGGYNYGDFAHQNYYYSRGKNAEPADNSVMMIDRTEIARQESGEPTAVSRASGEFAKAMKDW